MIRNLKETLADKKIILHTTFVKMNPEKLTSKNTHLLIYWVENQNNTTKQFITGFPVELGFVEKALDEKKLGAKKPIITRYNAWVPDLAISKDPLIGTIEAE